MKTKNLIFLFFLLCLSTMIVAQNSGKKGSNKEKTTYVKIETSYGTMKAMLYNETPKHRDNFVKLIRDGFYNDLLFHRVIRNFMLQGGDPNSKNAKPGVMLGNGNLGYTVPAEFNSKLIHRKGALCAARQSDQVNPTKASSASQFYIVQGQVWDQQGIQQLEQRTGKKLNEEQRRVYSTVGGTPFLDGDYTVFGQVIEGLDVIDKIASVATDRADRPVTDVKMKISIVEK